MRELIDRKSLIDALRKDVQEYKDTDGQSIPFKTGMIYRQIEAIKIIEKQPMVESPIQNIIKRLERENEIAHIELDLDSAIAYRRAINIVKEEGGIDDNT